MHKLMSLFHKRSQSSAASSPISSCTSIDRIPSWKLSDGDSDEERCSSDVPKGYFAVHAGTDKQRRRFIVSTKHLKHPIFRALLAKAAEEYGFSYRGALRIPCEAVLFEHFLWLLNRKDPACARVEQIDDLVDFYNA